MRIPGVFWLMTVLSTVAWPGMAQLLGTGSGAQPAAVSSDALQTYTYECLAVDCRVLVSYLGGESIQDPMAGLAASALDRPRPGRGWLVGGPAPYPEMAFAQWTPGSGATFQPFRPEGLEQVVGIVEQNAIVLRGTPEAIDKTLEFLEQIDKPAPMVRIELQAISTPENFDQGSGLQWVAFGPTVSASTSLGTPGAGSTLRYALGDIAFAVNQFIQRSQGYEDETISILTQSMFPAYMGVRNVEPTFLPVRGSDRYGNIITTYEVRYSVTETNLLVLPRVNRDDSVTMYLSPRFSREVGRTGPPGSSGFPIIETLGNDAVVTVRNGQTVAIGGLRRVRVDNTWAGGAIPADMIPQIRRTVTVENVTLFVTPHVYRLEEDPIEDIKM